jgi:hypothetical protein
MHRRLRSDHSPPREKLTEPQALRLFCGAMEVKPVEDNLAKTMRSVLDTLPLSCSQMARVINQTKSEGKPCNAGEFLDNTIKERSGIYADTLGHVIRVIKLAQAVKIKDSDGMEKLVPLVRQHLHARFASERVLAEAIIEEHKKALAGNGMPVESYHAR